MHVRCWTVMSDFYIFNFLNIYSIFCLCKIHFVKLYITLFYVMHFIFLFTYICLLFFKLWYEKYYVTLSSRSYGLIFSVRRNYVVICARSISTCCGLLHFLIFGEMPPFYISGHFLTRIIEFCSILKNIALL